MPERHFPRSGLMGMLCTFELVIRLQHSCCNQEQKQKKILNPELSPKTTNGEPYRCRRDFALLYEGKGRHIRSSMQHICERSFWPGLLELILPWQRRYTTPINLNLLPSVRFMKQMV